MRAETLHIARACLMHDLGRLSCRAGADGHHAEAGARALLNAGIDEGVAACARWHHRAALERAAVENDSPAYIVALADRIASGGADLTGETLPAGQPLMSIFNHMNGCQRSLAVPLRVRKGAVPLPLPPEQVRPAPDDYAALEKSLLAELAALPDDAAALGPMLNLLEARLTRVPAAAAEDDISLYDHLKMTAAVGCCLSEYLAGRGIGDYKAALFDGEAAFWKEPAFLLYSADYSGIQSFIYSIATRRAVRSLRSRSFFLELSMEHFIDELLAACGLCRANLLYSGGGHCYLLLPGTDAARAAVRAVSDGFNAWLRESFGARLYLADGWTACCAAELTNLYIANDPTATVFARVSREIAQRKMHRYSADQIRALNAEQPNPDGRECKICGRSSRLHGDDGLCDWCRRFAELSIKIQNQDVYVASMDGAASDFSFPSPQGSVYFTLTNEDSARARLNAGEPIRRIYVKNRRADLPGAIRLFVGDYSASNNVDDLAEDGRLAVCRMDVDNLGTAFTAGFVHSGAPNPYRYASLSRTSAFSRQMSVFFKYHINDLIDGLKTSIVYSGGDDVFLIGALEDTLEAACRIRTALRAFSGGALSISGGIGLFDAHYPLRRAAEDAAALEDCAKALPGKDAIALFEPNGSSAYRWDAFMADVKDSKLRVISEFFEASKAMAAYGNSFLYNLLDLLRQCGERINLARYAYLLSRMAPASNSPLKAQYERFSKAMMDWAKDPESRRQLITAIYLYVYHTRKER